MRFTGAMIDRYKPTLSWDKNPDAYEVKRVFDMSAQSLYNVKRTCFDKIAKGSAGIGDIVIPKSGPFAGIPFRCAGFTCQYIEPMFNLPAGKCSNLILSTLYADGCSTGLRIYMPCDEALA